MTAGRSWSCRPGPRRSTCRHRRAERAAIEKLICIHGHFYQPPRENPWLEAIERQDSAYPHHDWNARITEECYGPNAASRILDGDGRIVEIVNNYSKISFNFGPTILAWLETQRGPVYQAVISADRESRQRFAGHGSALAQAYNHMILPLANMRDRRTQVWWGIRDFQHRFGRPPEGMWLPETAANVDTLEALAQYGIHFTVLAPHQAARIREIGAKTWQDVTGARIDPTRAYLHRLPSGRSLAVFFYDGPISRAVAFERLLSRGERFAERLMAGFSAHRTWPQLMHIATDGETYGHHHHHGDMALAYAIRYIERNRLARLTNYGEYLERFPPTHEVQIIEDTSWSCAHGLSRWRSDCGCNSGGRAGWQQLWREPLRRALDWLRDQLVPLYEAAARELLRDPWAARDEYIEVVLDRSPENVTRFLAAHAVHELTEPEVVRALELLELQRHAMLMYTSCGWFFDELSGIETVQVIQYAGRAIQLAQGLFKANIEEPFLELLEQAQSNLAEHGSGRNIYERFVRAAALDLRKVAAHYALSSLFEPRPKRSRIYCYSVRDEERRLHEAGAASVAVGRVRLVSEITREAAVFDYSALHFGDHNVTGGVLPHRDSEFLGGFARDALGIFRRADFPALIRLYDRVFEGDTFTLRSLFRDEQRKVIDHIVRSAVQDAEAVYRQLYLHRAPLMRFVSDLDVRQPRAFKAAAEVVLHDELERELGTTSPDLQRIRDLLDEARGSDVVLDGAGLSYVLHETLVRLAGELSEYRDNMSLLRRLHDVSTLARSLPFEVNLWEAQNQYYDILKRDYAERRQRAERGDVQAREWVQAFEALGGPLAVAVPR